MNTAHVVPVNDLIAHELTDDCPCGPAFEKVPPHPSAPEGQPDGWVTVHHALDGRELVEP